MVMDKWTETLKFVACVLWISLLSLQEVHGDGIVSIRFLRYRNPGGKGSNGHCCDGRWSICNSPCDHQFTVCLDKSDGPRSIDSCYYGRSVTEKIKNQDENIFDESFGGLKNPLVYKIPGNINIMATLKIRVVDVDSGFGGGDDHVDDLTAELYVHKGPFADVMLPVTLHSRTRMETHITIDCDQDWYEEDCSVYCKPSREDNYYCDGWTGEKICHPGWMGQNCDVPEENV